MWGKAQRPWALLSVKICMEFIFLVKTIGPEYHGTWTSLTIIILFSENLKISYIKI
jgi:hypothetical protein